MLIAQLKYWLALWRTPGVGPVRFQQLLTAYPDLSELFSANKTQLHSLGIASKLIDKLQNPDWRAVEQDLLWSQTPHHHILTIHDSEYPYLLKEIHSAPPVLFIAGDTTLLNKPQLAIVGSRNPTPTGYETAHAFADYLAQHGLIITSGLALGIDHASHQGALANKGQTIAVLGSGLDKIYPYQHIDLAKTISAQGALISEFPLGTPARAEHFPQRNRIVSGLSLGTLVVEATLRSGSLITARFAAEQGREVFSIPGSIHNPQSRGCHALIRQGAKLVETTADILEELRPLASLTSIPVTNIEHNTTQNSLAADYRKLLECVGHESTPVDRIIERSGLATMQVTAMLIELELQGYIKTIAGGYSK